SYRPLVVEQRQAAPAPAAAPERRNFFVSWDALADRGAGRGAAEILEHADVLGAIRRQLQHGVLRLGRRKIAEATRFENAECGSIRRRTQPKYRGMPARQLQHA